MSLYEYQAKVINVIDGDTVHLDVTLGFHVRVQETFRLSGIDSPEKKTSEGIAAMVYLRKLLVEETAVRIITERDKKEKYGRYLAMIYLGEINVNELILKDGHAVPCFGGKR